MSCPSHSPLLTPNVCKVNIYATILLLKVLDLYSMSRSWDSSVSLVTRLWVGQHRNNGAIPNMSKRIFFSFYVHVTMHLNKFLYNKTDRRTNFQVYSGTNSICFGQLPCPSSVFHCTFSTGTC